MKEARRRWGQGGSLLKNDHGVHMVGFWGPKKQEYVGQFADEGMATPPLTWYEMGCGRSWEAAFFNANKREAK